MWFQLLLLEKNSVWKYYPTVAISGLWLNIDLSAPLSTANSCGHPNFCPLTVGIGSSTLNSLSGLDNEWMDGNLMPILVTLCHLSNAHFEKRKQMLHHLMDMNWKKII